MGFGDLGVFVYRLIERYLFTLYRDLGIGVVYIEEFYFGTSIFFRVSNFVGHLGM